MNLTSNDNDLTRNKEWIEVSTEIRSIELKRTLISSKKYCEAWLELWLRRIHVTMRCGAERNKTTVVRIVYKLRPSRQNLSITMAANFQSEITKSSSSFSLSLLVMDLSSLSMSLTSAERKVTRVVPVTLCRLQQQQWCSGSSQLEKDNISSIGLKVVHRGLCTVLLYWCTGLGIANSRLGGDWALQGKGMSLN